MSGKNMSHEESALQYCFVVVADTPYATPLRHAYAAAEVTVISIGIFVTIRTQRHHNTR